MMNEELRAEFTEMIELYQSKYGIVAAKEMLKKVERTLKARLANGQFGTVDIADVEDLEEREPSSEWEAGYDN